jgi:hypothetical protein
MMEVRELLQRRNCKNNKRGVQQPMDKRTAENSIKVCLQDTLQAQKTLGRIRRKMH